MMVGTEHFGRLFGTSQNREETKASNMRRHNGSSTAKLSASSLETENLPADGINCKSKHRPLAAVNRMTVLWDCVEYLIMCSVTPCRLLRWAAGASLPRQALGSLTAARSQALPGLAGQREWEPLLKQKPGCSKTEPFATLQQEQPCPSGVLRSTGMVLLWPIHPVTDGHLHVQSKTEPIDLEDPPNPLTWTLSSPFPRHAQWVQGGLTLSKAHLALDVEFIYAGVQVAVYGLSLNSRATIAMKLLCTLCKHILISYVSCFSVSFNILLTMYLWSIFEEAQAKWAESLLPLGCEALCDVSWVWKCCLSRLYTSKVSKAILVWP